MKLKVKKTKQNKQTNKRRNRSNKGAGGYLERQNLSLQLALELQKLVDRQLLVALRSEKVRAQRRIDALSSNRKQKKIAAPTISSLSNDPIQPSKTR